MAFSSACWASFSLCFLGLDGLTKMRNILSLEFSKESFPILILMDQGTEIQRDLIVLAWLWAKKLQVENSVLKSGLLASLLQLVFPEEMGMDPAECQVHSSVPCLHLSCWVCYWGDTALAQLRGGTLPCTSNAASFDLGVSLDGIYSPRWGGFAHTDNRACVAYSGKLWFWGAASSPGVRQEWDPQRQALTLPEETQRGPGQISKADTSLGIGRVQTLTELPWWIGGHN